MIHCMRWVGFFLFALAVAFSNLAGASQKSFGNGKQPKEKEKPYHEIPGTYANTAFNHLKEKKFNHIQPSGQEHVVRIGKLTYLIIPFTGETESGLTRQRMVNVPLLTAQVLQELGENNNNLLTRLIQQNMVPKVDIVRRAKQFGLSGELYVVPPSSDEGSRSPMNE